MQNLLKDLNKLKPLFTMRDRKKFIILFGLMVVASFLEAVGIGAIPLFVSMVMDPSSLAEAPWIGSWFTSLPNEPSVQIVFWASCILFGFIVLKNIFLSFVFYVQTRIITMQRVNLSHRMFRVYQTAPYEWHLQRSSSEMLNNIQGDTAQILRGVITPFLDLIMAIIMTALIIPVLIFGTPGPALMGLVVTGVGVYGVIHIFQKQFNRIGKVLRRENKKIIQAVQQGFGALVDARIIGCEDYLNKIHRDSMLREAKALVRHFTIQKSTPYLIETFAILGLLVILVILIQTSDSLGSALPVIALLGVATIRLKQLASKIANAINSMNAGRAFIPGIMNDIQELDAIETLRREKSTGSEDIGGFKELKLDNVSYSYPSTETAALHNISLQIKSGESIAFVGATGCGKSTLVNLILSLLEPQSGSITVNGSDIFQNIEGWRSKLGYIPQTIFLVDDTIRANVAFGISEDKVNDDRLWSAICSAQLDTYINSLPMGLETEVGERGVRLSGGQRQRLGIARALYYDPDVLVMDEATSALDNKTEEKVMQAIQGMKQGRSLIMIAHRLSTVQDCDRLYFLNHGQIDAVGSFDELKQISDAFRELVLCK